MSGICGDVTFDSSPASVTSVLAMVASLVPRGPDAAGLHAQNRYAFGHRRLQIVDPSEKSQQPMVDSDLGLCIVFDGFLTNQEELTRELAALGYRFFSTGATEVALKAFHAWGEKIVDHLAGMFAFAIHERESGRVILARDRLGIKPLYYTEAPGQLRFASTLPALVAAGNVDCEVDGDALHYYLHCQAKIPAPLTLITDIQKLPPATIRIYEEDGTIQSLSYWAPDFSSPLPETDLDLRADQFLARLRGSVSRHLRSDAPYGVLLENHLPSAILLALVAEQNDGPVSTFSAGRGDDSRFAAIEAVAQHLGADHQSITRPTGKVPGYLTNVFEAMYEPSDSKQVLDFFLQGQDAAKHTKALLRADGAATLFNRPTWQTELTDSSRLADAYAKANFNSVAEDYVASVPEECLREDVARDFIADQFARPGAETPSQKLLRHALLHELPNGTLRRIDEMHMSAAVEARLPFLDQEVVEFALKIQDDTGLLAAVGRKLLPEELVETLLAIPEDDCPDVTTDAGLTWAETVLSENISQARGVFKEDYVKTLIDCPAGDRTENGKAKLVSLAALETWLQTIWKQA